MSNIIVLDTTPLGLLTQKPGQNVDADRCRRWVQLVTAEGFVVVIPEIADYEVRRELIRAGKNESIARLDAAAEIIPFLPITSKAMRLASDLWAQARNHGWATADPKALDGDVILAAQALTIQPAPTSLVIATENVEHLSRYVAASQWRVIRSPIDPQST